jgi:hypothetical protein
MKNLLVNLCFIYFFFFVSCSDSKKQNADCCGKLILKESLQVYIDSFVRENNMYNIYELYIDKIDPHNFNLILYAGEQSLTYNENEYYNQISLSRIVVSGVEFSVYSGLEHYFDSSIPQKPLLQSNDIGSDEVLWAIKDSFGVLNCYTLNGAYPFIPFPIVIEENSYVPPEVHTY